MPRSVPVGGPVPVELILTLYLIITNPQSPTPTQPTHYQNEEMQLDIDHIWERDREREREREREMILFNLWYNSQFTDAYSLSIWQFLHKWYWTFCKSASLCITHLVLFLVSSIISSNIQWKHLWPDGSCWILIFGGLDSKIVVNRFLAREQTKPKSSCRN